MKRSNRLRGLAGLAVLCAATAAGAQSRPVETQEQLAAVIRDAMPVFLKDGGRDAVGRMLKIQLPPPLRSSFRADTAIRTLFGDASVVVSPDCRRLLTPTGDRDPGDCTATLGQEGGAGAYGRLSYSKNMGLGSIKFVKRDAVPTSFAPPPATTLSDRDAAIRGLEFLQKVVGIPAGEIPAGVDWSRQVRSLALNGGGETPASKVVLQKVLIVPRSFALPDPIADPANGNRRLDRVLAPGRAMVMLDDKGIAGVSVQDWAELRIDPNMSVDQAKSANELIGEIAEDLFNDGVRSIAQIRFQLVAGADWRGTYGWLLPAVRVHVSPVLRDPTEDEQQKLYAGQATAGRVMEYALVRPAGDPPAGDRPKP
jgi:hypothetical protein